MSLRKPTPNPELEILREDGLRGTSENHENIKDTVERLKAKTSRVHAGWLFYGDERALQKIMRHIDGHRPSTLYPGWKNFANALRIPREVINPIDSHSFGDEGYTYYVLLHYAQMENATIHDILSALLELSRFDVVMQSFKLLEGVADDAISYNRNHATNEPNGDVERNNSSSSEEDSGYFPSVNGHMGHDLTGSQSLGSDAGTDRSDIRDNHFEGEEMPETESYIIKPPTLRKVPIMLKHINENENHFITSAPIQALPPIRVENSLQTAAPDKVPPSSQIVKLNNNHQKKKNYTCIVMLTFANDGIYYANEVARILRKKRENGQKIGVVMMHEHTDTVESNPCLFVNGCFPQVHYIIPIITEGYIKAASTVSSKHLNEPTYVDCKYVRFIYDLMLKNYVDSGCLNKKTRCIIPDDSVDLIYRTFMRQPLFSAWERFSKTDELGERWVKRFSQNNKEN